MMKYLRYIFILLFASISFIIIDYVSAETLSITGGKNFCNGPTCVELNFTDFSVGFNNYYHLSYSSSISVIGNYPLVSNLYSIQPIDTTNYDYALFNVCTTTLLPSTISFVDSGVYAYSLTTTTMAYSPDYTFKYCSVLKADLTGVNSLRGAMQLQFSSLATSVTPTFFINKNIYFGSDNDEVINAIDKNTDAINGITDSINNSDTSGASSSSSSFFEGFEDNDYGLSDIITMPLSMIKNITSATCTPLSFPLPFVNKNATLPCMTEVYSQFGPVLSIYQTITFGMIAYWVCVNIFATVKSFKDPDRDEIEVVDL